MPVQTLQPLSPQLKADGVTSLTEFFMTHGYPAVNANAMAVSSMARFEAGRAELTTAQLLQESAVLKSSIETTLRASTQLAAADCDALAVEAKNSLVEVLF